MTNRKRPLADVCADFEIGYLCTCRVVLLRCHLRQLSLGREATIQSFYAEFDGRIHHKEITTIANLTQLIYASQPFGYDESTLNSILIDARTCNTRDDITGALVCRHDIYLQLIEGPSEQVEAAYTRITRDDRHAGVSRLVNRQVTDRMFGHWTMLHDPANSLIWTEDQIASGILDRTPEPEIVDMFESVARNAKPEDASLQL